jgi:hypothetical protein
VTLETRKIVRLAKANVDGFSLRNVKMRRGNDRQHLSLSETQSCWQLISSRAMLLLMREVCSLFWVALVGAFRSRASLEAENTILRHQLNVLRRKSPSR